MVGCERPAQEDVWVELQSRQWEFVQVEQSAMKFNASAAEQDVEVDAKQGFTIRFDATLDKSSEQYSLFEIADVLNVEVKRVNPDYNHVQNYKPYPLADGSLWVLEAALALQSPFSQSVVNHLRVGVPLSLLAEPFSGHEVVLHFTGVEFNIYVDGKLLNEPYIATPTINQNITVTVEKGCVFVMGDNRMNSKDSRSSEIGQIDKREILGKALILMWPGATKATGQRDLDRIGALTNGK